MKILLSLALLVVSTHAIDKEFIAQMKEKMSEHVKSCANAVSASSDDVADIFAHKIPASHEGKCIFFCLHKLFNAQNEDGSLNMAGALANLEIFKDLDADLYTKISTSFKNCEGTPVDSDPCVYATSLVECIVKEGKALGLDEAVIQ